MRAQVRTHLTSVFQFSFSSCGVRLFCDMAAGCSLKRCAELFGLTITGSAAGGRLLFHFALCGLRFGSPASSFAPTAATRRPRAANAWVVRPFAIRRVAPLTACSYRAPLSVPPLNSAQRPFLASLPPVGHRRARRLIARANRQACLRARGAARARARRRPRRRRRGRSSSCRRRGNVGIRRWRQRLLAGLRDGDDGRRDGLPEPQRQPGQPARAVRLRVCTAARRPHAGALS